MLLDDVLSFEYVCFLWGMEWNGMVNGSMESKSKRGKKRLASCLSLWWYVVLYVITWLSSAVIIMCALIYWWKFCHPWWPMCFNFNEVNRQHNTVAVFWVQWIGNKGSSIDNRDMARQWILSDQQVMSDLPSWFRGPLDWLAIIDFDKSQPNDLLACVGNIISNWQ
jgi:hypothetical protein